jgi:coenzyme F420-reducing hydrogenase alpha subunit
VAEPSHAAPRRAALEAVTAGLMRLACPARISAICGIREHLGGCHGCEPAYSVPGRFRAGTVRALCRWGRIIECTHEATVTWGRGGWY